MKVVVCERPGVLTLASRPVPDRAEGEVLIRVRRVGICGTDMHIVRGTQPFLTYPRVMGHELAGEVVESPPSSGLRPGEAVFVMPYLSCGDCYACRREHPNCCMRIQVLGVHRDGGLAEYLSLPQQFVRRAEGVDLDQAAMIEFLSIGAHAVRRAPNLSEQRTLVVGAGPIGMATAMFARLDGARVTMVDSREDRLRFCSTHLGIDDTLLLSADTSRRLADITANEFFEVVFDATGNTTAMETSFDYVAHGGTYVLLSVVSSRISFSDPDFHRREMTLMGSRNATLEDFDRVLRAMQEGLIPAKAFITHRANLNQLVDVMPAWMAPATNVVKGIVEC